MEGFVYTYVPLPTGIYVAALVVGELSSCLSILGSSLIIYLIIRERRWRTNAFFERIILGLSIADLISSWGMFLQPYLTPNLLLSVPSSGPRTCAISGFLGTFIGSSFMYSSALVIYFLTVVRRDRIVDVKPARSWELLIHAVVWVGGLVLAILMVSYPILRPSAFYRACLPLTLPEDSVAQTAVYLTSAIIFAVCLSVGFICTVVLYKRIRTLPHGSTTNVSNNSGSISNPSGAAAAADSYALSSMASTAPPPATPAAQQTRSTSAAAASYVHTASISRGSDEDTQRDDDKTKKRHNRFVAYQALFYSLAFLNTIVPTFIGGLVRLSLEATDGSAETETILFPAALFLFYTFLPLQGFVNCIIYLRPRLWWWKDANAERSWLWVLQQIIACEPLPPPTVRTAHLARPNRDAVSSSSELSLDDDLLAIDHSDGTKTKSGEMGGDDPERNGSGDEA